MKNLLSYSLVLIFIGIIVFLNPIKISEQSVTHNQNLGIDTTSREDKITNEENNSKKNEILEENNDVDDKEKDNIKEKKPLKYVALTFDDGPSSFTEEIIDLLQKYNYNATFFVLGNKLNLNYKDILKKSIKNGNEIGVHGYSHRSFTKMRQATMEEEITKTKKYIKNLTGYESTLVRPPYGNITKTIKNYNLGPYILWNNDTLDWKLRDANKISSRLINSIEDKSIILMHDTYLTTFKALEIILPYLKENNYVVTTVSKIYELNGITLENNKSYRYIK